MNNKFQQMLQTLIPFLLIGVALSLIVGLVIMFSYVLLWGILIGGVLWIISVIKNFLFPTKALTKTEGRIIEHNDRK
ncbi:MAG: hypothetical protein Q8M03_02785 [Legionella sp.]|nr:hypothetical protein [Legionella sp.]